MGYEHTQKSPLYLLILAIAAIMVGMLRTMPTGESFPIWILGGVSLLLVCTAMSFGHLTVRDEGEYLAVRFGPLPIFHRRFRYAQITGVEAARSDLLDGWGIHCVPGRGWIYNLWGLDCVRIRVGGKAVRIGTDDVNGLVLFLKSKVKC